jgi:hypothetical protein
VRPGWDDKVLADWNGMMIAADGAALVSTGRLVDGRDQPSTSSPPPYSMIAVPWLA